MSFTNSGWMAGRVNRAMPPPPPPEPIPEGFYDLYFWHARPENRSWWSAHNFVDVRLADVSCPYCKYKPQIGVLDPKRAFKQHLRLRHPEIKHRKKQLIIREEPDFAFSY